MNIKQSIIIKVLKGVFRFPSFINKNNMPARSLAIVMILFLLAGCGSQAKNNDSIHINTTIVGGTTGGAWSVFTEGIAESIRRENNGAYVTVEPGSIIENPLKVSVGKVPYGLSYAMNAYTAFHGEDPYNKAYDNIRAVSVVIPANYYHLMARDALPFNSVTEIIESQYPIRLAVNQKGSAGELITREILADEAVTYEDIISWGGSVDYLSASKAFEMMADGRIDAFGNAESAPSNTILEASATTDLKMLSIGEEILDSVSEKLGMEPNYIPADTYHFTMEDVKTISTPVVLIVHKDISEQEVYTITKSIYNSFDYLSTVHGEFKNLSAENMINVGKIPLHPGAEMFFKEKGMLD